jgi:hypothetical protein
VVCGTRVEVAHWPNAWEKSLAVRPCCSDACAKAFDADRHWMPSTAPRLLSEADANAAVGSAKARMARGDDAGPVARDLLIAGVPAWMVRSAVIGAGVSVRRRMQELAAMPFLTFGRWFAVERGASKHDPASGSAALDAIDAWERRFPDPGR